MIAIWDRETVFLSTLLLEMQLDDELVFANGMTVRRQRGRFTVIDADGESHEAFIGRSTTDNAAEAANAVVDHLTALRGKSERRLP